MNTSKRWTLALLALVGVGALGLGQAGPFGSGYGGCEGYGPGMMQGPGAGYHAERRAAHFQQLKQQLNLRPDQEAAWAGLMEQRDVHFQQHHGRMWQGQGGFIDHMSQRIEWMSERLAAMQAFHGQLQAFYGQLDESQQAVLDAHQPMAGSGPRGHHRGYGPGHY